MNAEVGAVWPADSVDDLRRVPWQIWVVVAMLALEGLGNLLTIPSNAQAAIWLAAKVLFVTGLLKRWRAAVILFLVAAALHVIGFSEIAPLVALLNLAAILLVAWVWRFYFPRPSPARE